MPYICTLDNTRYRQLSTILTHIKRAHPNVKRADASSLIKQESTAEADALAQVTLQLALQGSLKVKKVKEKTAPQPIEESLIPLKGDIFILIC